MLTFFAKKKQSELYHVKIDFSFGKYAIVMFVLQVVSSMVEDQSTFQG